MRMVTIPFLTLVFILCAFLSTHATIIHIPADYATIQAGINAAIEGDTVLVAPGRYLVNLDFAGKNICLKSEAGPWLTLLEPDSLYLPIINFASHELSTAKVVGFTICRTRGNAAIRVDRSSPSIEENIFTDIAGGRFGNNSAIYNDDSSQAVIKNNLFWKNDSAYCIVWFGSSNSVTVLNNTIHSGRLGIYLYGQNATVKNNIVTGCQMGVSSNATATRGYNDVWGNGTDWPAGSPASSDISADPDFIDAASGNFALLRSSPCIDAGEDSVQYNSPDGTRNDIGAIQFDQTCPTVNNMNPGTNISHLTNHTPTFYWSFYDTVYLVQNGFQIQLGTDNDWTMAENWSYGPVISSDTSALYSGAPLTDGETYYWRIRASNSVVQSEWKESVFRMNSMASAPIPVFPISGEGVSQAGVNLKIENSSDSESDILTYDFEIYDDPSLMVMVASQTGVGEGDSITSSDSFGELTPGEDYFWRARGFDGYEYGDWTTTESFVVRTPVSHNVPADYATIQEAIDAAQEQDTVLVAPGSYTGDGNRDLDFKGKNLKLVSDGIGQATIDCGGTQLEPHRAIYLHNEEDTSAVIDGFIITGAYYSQYWDGVISLLAGATIRNCAIINNSSNGIIATATAPNYLRYRVIIEDCLFQDNHNGIEAIANVQISNCRFISNDTSGLYLSDMDSVTVQNCLFFGNGQYGIRTSTGSWGNYAIMNNTIVMNGGGIYFWYDPPKAPASEKAPIDLSYISTNLVAFNLGIGIESDGLGFVGVSVQCNNSYGNVGEDYHPGSPYGPFPGDTLGNISADPQFCDLDTAYSVSNLSPCLPANNSCGVLIGAFGVGCYYQEICGDADGSGVVNISDVTYLLSFLYKGGPAPIPILRVGDVNGSGGVNILDVTYLISNLYKNGPALQCP